MSEKNLIAVMTGQVCRAAAACTSKNDVRYYLNGIHIDGARGKVVGTNGHIMYVGPAKEIGDAGVDTKIIIALPTVPLNVETVSVYRDEAGFESTLVRLMFVTGTDKVTYHVAQLIDGRYPDYQTVSGLSKPVPYSGHFVVGYNAEYLSLLPKIFGKQVVTLTVPSPHGATHVTCPKAEGLVVLMPCKV